MRSSLSVGKEMVLRGRLPRIWAFGRILRTVKSWNYLSAKQSQDSGRNILKRENWRKLNEGTVDKGMGKIKRNQPRLYHS